MKKKSPEDDDAGDRGISLGSLLEGFPSTDTIDLSTLFTQDLTMSGSFDVSAIGRTTFGKLLLALPIPAFLIDDTLRITFCNEALGKLANDTQTVQGRSFFSLFPDAEEIYGARTSVTRIFEERKPLLRQGWMQIGTRTIWARIYFRSVRLDKERAILILIEDLTLEKQQLQLMKTIERAKKEWERTFDAVSDLIATVEKDYRVVRLNRAMAEKIGIRFQDAVGEPCYRLVHGTDRPPAFCGFMKLLSDGNEHSQEYYEKHLDCYLHETICPIHDDSGALMGCVIAARDITGPKKLEKELQRLAGHDDLTGLFNRRQVREMLNSAFEGARRYLHPLSLCIFDMDNLKEVNDKFGHPAGDEVLKHMGEIVRKGLRRSDFAGRYGGDEFIIVFPNTQIEGASECMERIREALGRVVFQADMVSYKVSCSGGVVEYVCGDDSPDDLVRRADRALYTAKEHGRNRIVLNGMGRRL